MSNTAVQTSGPEAAGIKTPGRSPDPATRDERALLPPVDVVEDATGITLYADLPGIRRERLNLRVEGDTLIIEGDLSLPVPQDLQVGHVEVQAPRYRRSFTLSKELDADKIGAELSLGVLQVRIPKAKHAQPRRIQVQAD